MPVLRDGGMFAHPIVAGTVDQRLWADLLTLSEAAPALLDALDRLPQALAHGDASPPKVLDTMPAPTSWSGCPCAGPA